VNIRYSCRFTNKIIDVEPDKENKEKLQEAIDFVHLKTTPNGVASLTLLVAFFICFPTMVSIALNALLGLPGLSFGYGFLIMLLSMPFVYYLYKYPFHLKKKYEMEVGSEIVTMILYIAMYMRNVPNLERAVKFASENITGPLAYELRKLIWDLEIRKYFTIEDALNEYVKKWEKNRPFVESIEIIITSLRQPGPRRLEMLDEAVDVILKGHRENAKHFNQKLKMPVMVVHAMGIILPVLGLVLFPIVSIFLDVKSIVLFVGYDVILPIILFFIISNILELRPVTYSVIDISQNPEAPPKGKFKLKGKNVPAWPFGLFTFVLVLASGIFALGVQGENSVLPACLITGSAAFGFSVYYLLLSKTRVSIREKTRQIEDEFAEALFQLGNQIYTGTPIEVSLEKSISRIKNLKIKQFFKIAINNMKTFGMTFSQAFFDPQYGAIRYYPSKTIKTIMNTIVESTKKGVRTASVAMLSVSHYMKNIHITQEEVRDELSDTVNSLKFQAFFLSPFISGIIVTLALIIIKILEKISTELTTTGMGATGVTQLPLMLQFQQINITPFQFILIVGIYLIETCFILSYFINGIENGPDEIGRKEITGYALVIGFIVFIISLFITLSIFEPLVLSSIL